MRSLGSTPACFVVLLLVGAPALAVETVNIPASRDATLIEDPSGSAANGSGPALFVGSTAEADNAVRRAVLWFDVGASLPQHAQVRRAFLTLHLTQSHDGPVDVGVHRLLADWSEGPSMSSGGAGAPSQPGDCTWLHRHYDDQLWRFPGGQFIAGASATIVVAAQDFYTWPSEEPLVADVRMWLRSPDRNFGWILLGDEVTPQSVKRFDSREGARPEFHPVLTVEYDIPGRAARVLP